MDCIFCSIAAGKIPAEVVHTTDRLVVVKDVNPQAPTHLLVIPKKHYRNIVECDDTSIFGEMISTAVDVAKEHGFVDAGFRTTINTNEEGGQTVWHLHMHLMAGRPMTGRMG
jgi:histidine triad (HIT) family protein